MEEYTALKLEGFPAESLHGEIEQLRKWRRHLHQIPELELDLPQTASYLKEQLSSTGGEIIELENCGSSFAVWYDFGQDHAVAFRTDMDALPVTETCNHTYVSRIPGRMHACGHDGHMTNLLLLASRLGHRKENPNNVLLLFQAGEETPGGAELICQTGLLQQKNVRAVFGLHLWPALEKGILATRPLEMMARASEIDVVITGRSAHCAKYREGIDAMTAGMDMLKQMYEMEAAMPDDTYRLLRFGCMQAGSVRNAVADRCVLQGSIRAFLDDVFDEMTEKIAQIAARIEEKHGVSVQITYLNGYPSVLNDVELTEKVLESCRDVQRLEAPEMIAEDFAFYGREVPAVFFFLGTGTGIPLHASDFDFDESLLLAGASLFERLAKADWAG